MPIGDGWCAHPAPSGGYAAGRRLALRARAHHGRRREVPRAVMRRHALRNHAGRWAAPEAESSQANVTNEAGSAVEWEVGGGFSAGRVASAGLSAGQAIRC
jgi:ribosomal protein L13E